MAEQITTSKGLLEPVLELGLEDVHFFNGRLLTALDLQKMQEANRLQHHQLGQAIGAGVVWGLEVSLVDDGSGGDPPVVSVSAGSAVNRFGQALTLPAKTSVMLTDADEAAPQDAGLFQMCTPPKGGTVPTGEGIYVLTVKLASGFREWVPKRGLGEDGQVDGCGRRYTVEGVQFHLEELSLDTITGLDQDTRDEVAELMEEIDELRFTPDELSQAQRRAKLSKLRNWLAHVCLGTEEVAGFGKDPFEQVSGQSSYVTYGAADALRAEGKLTDCDVPLALLYWTTSRVHFVDNWSVRRRLTAPLHSTVWPLPLGRRQMIEAEAAFQQFQDQMRYLVESNLGPSGLAAVHVKDYFRYLPPAGLIPIADLSVASLGTPPEIQARVFFDGLTVRDPGDTQLYIEGARLTALIHDSLAYPAIDLTSAELIWLYFVRENQRAVDLGDLSQSDLYLVFANGHMPYRADARYDANRWDYANFV
ncbi:MAG: hypothetical protein JW918_12600 [Anaerolineae bacterium]|nr:hypothetical protein [Anaerolineae bacterium]